MYCIKTDKLLKRLLFIAVAGWLLQACSTMPLDWNPQDYTVKRGDTLYSIAWRYEKDFKDLALWNNISPPYAIYPGQRLHMEAANDEGTAGREFIRPVFEPTPETAAKEPAIAAQEPPPQRDYVVVQKGDTLYSIAREESLTTSQLARWNRISRPYAIYPGQKLRLTPPSQSLGSSARIDPPVVVQPKVASLPEEPEVDADALPTSVSRWNWPVNGEVVKTFNAGDTARKGIAIAGNRGQDIKAAAAGKVVYSGNGLISYGNLVIIKHSNSFLSAYAHNRKLMVREGDSVAAGQVIAHMGTVENGRAQLHFEIRKDGKPVNPLGYLPKRRG